MSTDVPGFQSLFQVFCVILYWPQLATAAYRLALYRALHTHITPLTPEVLMLKSSSRNCCRDLRYI